jgi:hypothetical protein
MPHPRLVVVIGVLVAATALIVSVVFGSRDWRADYFPSVSIAVLELTLGAALVGGFLAWERRSRKARLSSMIANRVGRSLGRIVGVIQASYVESVPHRVPAPPMTVAELLDEWLKVITSLDLHRPSTLEPSATWAAYLRREVMEGLNELADTAARFTDLTDHLIEPIVALEDDDFVALLRHLPLYAERYQPHPPSTLPGYFGWTELAGPVLLRNFADRVLHLVKAAATPDDESLIDKLAWIPEIPPLWSSGRVARD